MAKTVQPSQADIDRLTTLLIHGHLTDIYALQKVNVGAADLTKLSLRDILLITEIGLEPNITSSKLSRMFRISSPLLSTRITALMRLELVQQSEDLTDRRVHNLTLLPKGTEIFDAWYARLQELAKQILTVFPRENVDNLESNIDFLLNTINGYLKDI